MKDKSTRIFGHQVGIAVPKEVTCYILTRWKAEGQMK